MVSAVFTGLAKFTLNFLLPGAGAVIHFFKIASIAIDACKNLYSAVVAVIKAMEQRLVMNDKARNI
jgi:hypothetical protein